MRMPKFSNSVSLIRFLFSTILLARHADLVRCGPRATRPAGAGTTTDRASDRTACSRSRPPRASRPEGRRSTAISSRSSIAASPGTLATKRSSSETEAPACGMPTAIRPSGEAATADVSAALASCPTAPPAASKAAPVTRPVPAAGSRHPTGTESTASRAGSRSASPSPLAYWIVNPSSSTSVRGGSSTVRSVTTKPSSSISVRPAGALSSFGTIGGRRQPRAIDHHKAVVVDQQLAG